ncbi:MAG: LPS export ABC transporter periplasmic protein LptC [Treponema sp.]|nr:LPS export ABC transporter periplasmic protein LptC [Treponema sp.]MCR5623287.1 LPS export ABC transporter periplasmic protein LptC [Treponema sp.]
MEASLTKVVAVLFIPLLAACSLDYTQNRSVESSSPEFTLKAASFYRYENNTISFSLDSPRIEQYSSPSTTFVEDASFSSYSKQGTLETTGRCSLLGIDQSGENGSQELTFYGSVVLERLEDGMTLEGEALKWNTGTGKLASSMTAPTSLVRGGLSLEGMGFSAREKDGEFQFASQVSGFIVTDDEEGGNR